MTRVHRLRHGASIALAALLLAACANKMEPAQKMISQIDSTVAAASADASKYVPDQMKDVQDKLDALKASFANKDYAAVITGAPAVLASAQGLAAAAAAKKTEVMQALNDQWSKLSGSLPADTTAIEHRLQELARNRRMARGIDLAAAKQSLGEVTTTWSKAQAAFAAGNLQEAVSTAKDVQTKIASLAGTLKLKLADESAGGAAAATSGQ
ncbi:MAG: hypothetical protein KGL34_10575 [Gammaproteobacteria bacterium]|nr:hypothetical protein [Gammaproteobacteria bacterium]